MAAVSKARRRWPRRLLIVGLVVANLVVFGAFFALRSLSSSVERSLNRDEDVVRALTPTTSAPKPGETLPDGTTPARAAVTFLIIGSDSREGTEDLAGNFGTAVGRRADVIMLLKLYPDESRAQVLSIPRDLKVDIEGHGTNKVNAAYAFGGGELMVQTVQSATGLPINHYLEVDFAGFASIVDQLGGVTLTFPYPARDLTSGFHVDAGSQRLDGAMALAYARARHYQELIDGSWTSVDASDIGRTRRQQQLILAMLSEIKRPSTLTDAAGLVEALAGYATVDATLGQGDILDLAWSLRALDSSTIESATLPTYGKTIDGRSYQLPREPEASALLAAFAAGESLSLHENGPIRVQVLNGNGVAGAAAAMAAQIESDGVEIVDVGDAERNDFAATQIIARSDKLSLARAVAELIGFGEVVPGTVPGSVDVIVIVGRDS